MNAQELLSPFFPDAAPPTRVVESITENTARADAGSLFVCIRGARFDGHLLADRAYANGCRLFVAEEALTLPDDAYVLSVPDTRRALAELASAFYDHPSRKMHVIGLTGTKGKTTTAHLLAHILNTCGIPCGYIGTNGIAYRDVKRTTANTTPDAVTFQRTLAEMWENGIRAAVVEVSSQALMQSRVWGTRFETVLFTNLYHDHIGTNEHASFEEYRAWKHTLFTDYGAVNAVWNIDDPACDAMRPGCTATQSITCAAERDADFRILNPTPIRNEGALGIRFSLSTKEEIHSLLLPLSGLPNAYNAALAAAVAVRLFSVPLSRVADALKNASVDGRSEVIALPNGATAIIDYAHNGESLRQALLSLRAFSPRRLLCLFGSVGERTQSRRSELGKEAAALADLSILTSDNPGNEPPERIIDEIAIEFERVGAPYLRFADRKEAIEAALNLLQAGDILLLAGKGHEAYQLIGKEKLPFSEREILNAYVARIQSDALSKT